LNHQKTEVVKMKKSLVWIVLIGLLAAGGYYYQDILKHFKKPHVDQTQTSDRTNGISEIINLANKWYLNSKDENKKDLSQDSRLPLFYNTVFYHYWHNLANQSLGKLIRAAVDKEGLRDVDHWAAKWYLRLGSYNSNATVRHSTLPLFNYCLFGYNKSKPENNQRVFEIATLLLGKGANINSLDIKSGRTALHEAIFFNQEQVVTFLINNRADPLVKVNQPKSVFHGHTALAFAKKIDKMDNNIDYSAVVKLVEKHQLTFKSDDTNAAKTIPRNTIKAK